MLRAVRGSVVAGIAVVAASLGASAQTPPVIDMRGTWLMTGEEIIDGMTPHHPTHAEGKAGGKYRLREEVFTFKFEGQEGKRFWGTISSQHFKDGRQIGSISPDGKWIYLVGNNSFADAVIVNADTIETCVRHITERTALVACGVLKRQK